MAPQIYSVVAVLFGVALGCAGAWFFFRQQLTSALAIDRAVAQSELASIRERLFAAEAAKQNQSDSVAQLSRECDRLRQLVGDERVTTAKLSSLLDAERQQSNEKLATLQEARESLSNQFKSLANEILEEKSKRFTEQNQTNLNQLLEPLKTRLTEFQGKVEEVYVNEGKDRSTLAEQVRQLQALNQRLSQEANDLTRALKGSNKAQGNWGELILERVLETSGLRKDHEYQLQPSHVRDDGTRGQPDVVIHMPEGKHLVVDAKVSLTAYSEYVAADSDDDRSASLSRHLESIRAHLKGLSARAYQDLHGLKSLDFVVMFVPIEPAFMLAVAHDAELWHDAWKKNVLLVSPSTLLFVVRTVSQLWRQEAQNRNAQDIAKRGADLYDKLVSFVDDLQTVGDRLSKATEAFDSAKKKLGEGRGNVIRQAELLKELGVKPTKLLPQSMVQASFDESVVRDSRLEAKSGLQDGRELA